MARRPLGYLHQNRHGTFTFRWRPPLDVAGHFGQPAFEFSLSTKTREIAWRRALPATMRANLLVSMLHAITAPKTPKKPFLTTELVRYLVLPDGNEHKVDYDPGDPAEVAEANRIFAELTKGVPLDPAEIDHLESMALQPPPPTRAAGGGLKISEAFAAFCTEKKQSGAWKDPEHAERYDFGPIIKELIGVSGDRLISQLSIAHLRTYKSQVMDSSLALRTQRKKVQRLRSFLNWARDIAQYTAVSSAVLQLGRRKGDETHYEPFDDADLQRLFESDANTTQSFTKASEFWIPLMGLYSGACINELAQLLVDDIGEQDGLPVMRINDEGDKRTKTPASIRSIPIHPALLAVGLLSYRDAIKAEGWQRLFPELTRSRVAKNAYGKEPSKHFTAYRRECDVSREADRQKVFHSFRTTANSVLRFRHVPQERRERLVGHEPEGTNNKDYRPTDRDQMYPMATLLEELKQLSFPLKHPVCAAPHEHRQQRMKAARRRVERGEGEPPDAAVLDRRGLGRTAEHRA